MISIGVIGSIGKSAIVEIIKRELLKNGERVIVVEENDNQSGLDSDSIINSNSSGNSNMNTNDDSDSCDCSKISGNNSRANKNSNSNSNSNSNEDSNKYSQHMNNSEISKEFTITSISSKYMLDNTICPNKFDILIQAAIEEKSNERIEELQNAVMSIKENGYFIFDSDFIQSISFPCESIYPITYGLNGRTTITTSSIDDTEKLSFNYCLQRSIISLTESIIQPFEIPVKVDGKYSDVNYYLAAFTCLLILGYKF
jgi:hypothetical protein